MRRSCSKCTSALAALVTFLVFCAACDQRENKFVPPPAPQVAVSPPEQRSVTDYLDLTGNTQAVDRVHLVARVDGFLTSIHFQDGDYVKKGDLLFLIEQDVYKARLQQAEGKLTEGQAQLVRASQEYDRQITLLKQNATAKSEVEKWKAERDAVEANIVEAKANVELARINLGYTRVTAPFDGRMDRHLVTPGNLVGSGERTRLATITRLDPIYVYFTLNERDRVLLVESTREKGRLNYKETAMPVFAGLDGEEGYPHEGRLDFVSTGVDTDTGTILLRAVFSNPLSVSGARQLVPGMFVRVRVPIKVRENALLVSERALGVDQGGRYVLVVNDKEVVEQRPVKVGADVDGMRVIENGLKADDRVVVNGIQRARPGAKVTPVQEGAASTPAAAGPAAASTKP
jgi:membrane fusion protein, multidrug efflux system